MSTFNNIFSSSPTILTSGVTLNTIPASENIGSVYSFVPDVTVFSPTMTSSVTLSSPSSSSRIINVGIASILISPFSLSAAISTPKKLLLLVNSALSDNSPETIFASIPLSVPVPLLVAPPNPRLQSTPNLSNKLLLVSIMLAFIITCFLGLSNICIILPISKRFSLVPLMITLFSNPVIFTPLNPFNFSAIFSGFM